METNSNTMKLHNTTETNRNTTETSCNTTNASHNTTKLAQHNRSKPKHSKISTTQRNYTTQWKQTATQWNYTTQRNILKGQLKAFQLEICYQLLSSPHPLGNQFRKCLISKFFISPPFRGSQGSLAGSSELDQKFTSERDGEWGREGRCQVRWASRHPTLHCSLIISSAVTTEISHTVILYVSSSLRLDTGGYLDTDALIFSDRFSPEVHSCFS